MLSSWMVPEPPLENWWRPLGILLWSVMTFARILELCASCGSSTLPGNVFFKTPANSFSVCGAVNTNMAGEYVKPVRHRSRNIPPGWKEQHMVGWQWQLNSLEYFSWWFWGKETGVFGRLPTEYSDGHRQSQYCWVTFELGRAKLDPFSIDIPCWQTWR